MTNIENNACNKHSTPSKKRIAIIGSGVSGLTCAHYLIDTHDVTIFEANDYIGGHVNTIDVTLGERKNLKNITEKASVDTGFIVFNERTYPNFFRLLHELDVPFQKTDMSFSVRNNNINFEYNGHTLNTLLSQRKNILSGKFWRFARDIIHFNKQVKQLRLDYLELEDEYTKLTSQDKKGFSVNTQKKRIAEVSEKLHQLSEQTLGHYLADKKHGKLFSDNYLLPMVSAIWSMGLEESKKFPLIFFAQFFNNHGLLEVINRPQWFTIKGGSKQYVNKLVQRFVEKGGKILVNSPVQGVTRQINGVTVNYKLNTDATDCNIQQSCLSEQFDEIIFACHASISRKLLADISFTEAQILDLFKYNDNEAILHTDTSTLPKKPLAWASWNYLLNDNASNKEYSATTKPVLTYHMNILQRLVKSHNYLVTLNYDIDDKHIIKRTQYRHPVYDVDMTKAQKRWKEISNKEHTHFCGAYWLNGFHEDGVKSGIRVCKDLGVDIKNLDTVNLKHLKNVAEPIDNFSYNKIDSKADKNVKKLAKRTIISAKGNHELNKLIK